MPEEPHMALLLNQTVCSKPFSCIFFSYPMGAEAGEAPLHRCHIRGRQATGVHNCPRVGVQSRRAATAPSAAGLSMRKLVGHREAPPSAQAGFLEEALQDAHHEAGSREGENGLQA